MRNGRRHPAVDAHLAWRAASAQLRLADLITRFAGTMQFVYVHVVWFAVWITLVERAPWPMLTLIVSLEAIFLSTLVMIGQNRQGEFQRLKADHDYQAQTLELQTNTALTREIHAVVLEGSDGTTLRLSAPPQQED